MAYGIGSVIGDIDQKVDTYRNNPEALMQMYQQNQQLVDLLALQKLKTEKEAAMRDMQLKSQVPAATIKDQREQEVMGMMRNEVAQQIAPGLQAMAQQSQAQAQPQGGGISSVPAPNMQDIGMAGGGIVAFAGGGKAEDRNVDNPIVGYNPDGTPITRADLERSLFAFEQTSEPTAEDVERRNRYAALAGKGEFSPPPKINPPATEKEAGISGQLPRVDRRALAHKRPYAGQDYVRLMENPELALTEEERQLQAARDMGLVSDERPPAPQAAPQPAPKAASPVAAGIRAVAPQIDEETAFQKSLRSGLPALTTPMPTREEEEADALMNVSMKAVKQAPPEVQNEYTRRLSELRAEQEDKLETLIEFLKGAGGKTTFAATMAGGAEAMNAREDRIKAEIMATADKIEGLKLKEREMGVAEEKNIIAREGNKIQERLGLGQIAASERNADLDFRAAMAGVDATNYNTLADYRAAMADKAASSAKALAEAMQSQQLTTAQRLDLYRYFDENMQDDVQTALIEQIKEKGESAPDSPEGQKIIQDGVVAARNAFVLQRINEVGHSYGNDPLFDAADAIIGG